MNLSDDEKKVIRTALERHLEEIKSHESDVNQDVRELATEVSYEEFVESIIKKLK